MQGAGAAGTRKPGPLSPAYALQADSPSFDCPQKVHVMLASTAEQVQVVMLGADAPHSQHLRIHEDAPASKARHMQPQVLVKPQQRLHTSAI